MAAKRKCSESELIKNAFFANCSSRPSDFLFQNLSISVLGLNNFRLTSKTGLFLPVLATFTLKLCLYICSCFIVMWLSFSILVPGELFLIHFQRYVLTGSSVSNPKFRFGFL